MSGNSKRVLANGRYARFIEEDGWEYVERLKISGIVLIVAVNAEGEVVLVEQYRHAVGCSVVELPAGLAGDVPGQEHETLEIAARRELVEETGYEAETMELLLEGYPSAGLCSERLTLFRAGSLKKVGPGGGDESESIIVHEVKLCDIDKWLADQQKAGKAIDMKIHTGLYFLSRS